VARCTLDGDTSGGSGGGSEQTIVKDSNDPYSDVPRNAPCPCGSGKKYKRCHGDPRNRST
jgi:preprotein translocase subunit SecA